MNDILSITINTKCKIPMNIATHFSFFPSRLDWARLNNSFVKNTKLEIAGSNNADHSTTTFGTVWITIPSKNGVKQYP